MAGVTTHPERGLNRQATVANLRSAIAASKAVADAARATAAAIAAERKAQSGDGSGDGSGASLPKSD